MTSLSSSYWHLLIFLFFFFFIWIVTFLVLGGWVVFDGNQIFWVVCYETLDLKSFSFLWDHSRRDTSSLLFSEGSSSSSPLSLSWHPREWLLITAEKVRVQLATWSLPRTLWLGDSRHHCCSPQEQCPCEHWTVVKVLILLGPPPAPQWGKEGLLIIWAWGMDSSLPVWPSWYCFEWGWEQVWVPHYNPREVET